MPAVVDLCVSLSIRPVCWLIRRIRDGNYFFFNSEKPAKFKPIKKQRDDENETQQNIITGAHSF